MRRRYKRDRAGLAISASAEEMTVRRAVKVSLWSFGALGLAFLGVLLFLLVSFGSSKDQTRLSAQSPDGKFVAELHTVMTPMHGGPDILYVAIRGENQAFGDTVFSRVYECDGVRAFLSWRRGPSSRSSNFSRRKSHAHMCWSIYGVREQVWLATQAVPSLRQAGYRQAHPRRCRRCAHICFS